MGQHTEFILLFLVSLVVAGWFVSRAVLRWMGPVVRTARVHGSACGRCGHAAGADESVRCSECGVAYDIAGIATPQLVFRTGVPIWAAVIGILPACIMLSILMSYLISAGGSYWRHGIAEAVKVKNSFRAIPNGSDGFRGNTARDDFRIEFSLDGAARRSDPHRAPVTGTIRAHVDGDLALPHWLTYSIKEKNWVIENELHRVMAEGKELAAGIEQLLILGGLDPNDEAGARAIQETLALGTSMLTAWDSPSIFQVPFTGLPGSVRMEGGGGSASVTASLSGDDSSMPFGLIFGMAIFLITLALIDSERRRILYRSEQLSRSPLAES